MANEEFEPIISVVVTDQMVEAGTDKLYAMLGSQASDAAAYPLEEVAGEVFRTMLAQASTVRRLSIGGNNVRPVKK